MQLSPLPQDLGPAAAAGEWGSGPANAQLAPATGLLLGPLAFSFVPLCPCISFVPLCPSVSLPSSILPFLGIFSFVTFLKPPLLCSLLPPVCSLSRDP